MSNLHKCINELYDQNKSRSWGNAISECYENEQDEFWVENGEYDTEVNFCPFCGKESPKHIEYEAV